MAEAMELEERLVRLSAEIEWPATPRLAARVRARIAAPARMPRRPWFQSRWALAAALVLAALTALLGYTPSRDAIASWLNLHSIISRVSELPTPSPQAPGPIGKRLGLGNQTTLADAQSRLGWKIHLPASLGTPDEVYLQTPPAGPPKGEVTLVYASRPGIPASIQLGVAVLITEATGTVDSNFFGKMLGPDTTLEEVTVNGHQGYWIAGAPHVFFFIDADGNFRNETLRLATNTLLLDDNGTVIRIEGDLTKAQALEIAASLT
ncbi:MAG TPA: hypothetical protein VLR46_08820 [Candidatus Dormibacteraeota bacterium]|nr:hypothetical protein [Candidatus Dormibacteraeota bacterium]